MLNNPQEAIEKLFKWFSMNYLVAKADKCHLLTSSKTAIDIHISDVTISNEKRVKLRGINLESRLNFDFHVETLRKKASKAYHALTRVNNYIDSNKKRTHMNAFIKSQYSDCPLVWTFHNSTLNNNINRLHEKALKILTGKNCVLLSSV